MNVTYRKLDGQGSWLKYVLRDDGLGAKYILPDGTWNNFPGHDQLIADGWLKETSCECSEVQRKTNTFTDNQDGTCTCIVEDFTQGESEAFYLNKRDLIKKDIYLICRNRQNQITEVYGDAEAARWSTDRAQYEASNWSYFDNRSGSHMTGQEYAETRIKPKIEAGDYIIDQLISIRNDLIYTLDNTADADLSSFDYHTMWDEKAYFTEPTQEEETATPGIIQWWNNMMAKIPWKLKLW